MLTLEQCRELVPNHVKYTDKQIEEIRASLYGLAELALDCYVKDNQGKRSSRAGTLDDPHKLREARDILDPLIKDL